MPAVLSMGLGIGLLLWNLGDPAVGRRLARTLSRSAFHAHSAVLVAGQSGVDAALTAKSAADKAVADRKPAVEAALKHTAELKAEIDALAA
jgi:hypothetical protein